MILRNQVRSTWKCRHQSTTFDNISCVGSGTEPKLARRGFAAIMATGHSPLRADPSDTNTARFPLTKTPSICRREHVRPCFQRVWWYGCQGNRDVTSPLGCFFGTIRRLFLSVSIDGQPHPDGRCRGTGMLPWRLPNLRAPAPSMAAPEAFQTACPAGRPRSSTQLIPVRFMVPCP